MNKLAVIMMLSLAGCGFTPQGDLVRDLVKEKGAQAYDEGLENSIWFICNAASVGSIRRRFGGTADSAAAYRALCSPLADIIYPAR
jgi:hypothetical protein